MENITILDIKFLTWLIMDGTWVCRASKQFGLNVHHLQFKLSKQRKIDNLCNLLIKMRIPYTLQKATKSGANKLQPYMIRIYSIYAKKYYTLLAKIKQMPEYFKNFTLRQFLIVLEVITQTDGKQVSKNRLRWRTTSENNLKIIEYLCDKYNRYYKVNTVIGTGFNPNCILYDVTIEHKEKVGCKI